LNNNWDGLANEEEDQLALENQLYVDQLARAIREQNRLPENTKDHNIASIKTKQK
jgi:hypothetical protein